MNHDPLYPTVTAGPMQQRPGDGAELGKEHEPCFVEEVDGTTVLTPLSLALEIGIPLKPVEGEEGKEG